MDEKKSFSYWKHPFGKWVVLVGAVLQTINLYLLLKNLDKIYQAQVLSSAEWEAYLAEQAFLCSCTALNVFLFFGIFFVGFFARSKRTALLGELAVLGVCAFIWSAAGVYLWPILSPGAHKIWLGLVLLFLLVGIVCVVQLKVSKNSLKRKPWL